MEATTLHGVSTQKNSTRLFTAVKKKNSDLTLINKFDNVCDDLHGITLPF